MKKTILTICAAVLVLGACAGSPVDWSKARSVTVGMTDKEVANLMGKPYMVSSRGDKEIWVYTHVNGLTGSSNSVSFVMQEGKVASVPKIPDSFQ